MLIHESTTSHWLQWWHNKHKQWISNISCLEHHKSLCCQSLLRILIIANKLNHFLKSDALEKHHLTLFSHIYMWEVWFLKKEKWWWSQAQGDLYYHAKIVIQELLTKAKMPSVSIYSMSWRYNHCKGDTDVSKLSLRTAKLKDHRNNCWAPSMSPKKNRGFQGLQLYILLWYSMFTKSWTVNGPLIHQFRRYLITFWTNKPK